MSKTAYAERLRDPRWQRKRLEVMSRDQFSCRLCGDSESTLNVHHLWYRRGSDPWDYPDSALVTTCEECHEELHAFPVGGFLMETLIAGGASMENLKMIFAVFEFCLINGPSARHLSPQQWEAFEGILQYAVMATQGGAEVSQVREALAQYVWPDE